MQSFRKLIYLLTPKEIRSAVFLLVMILVMAMIDTIGVASILPFMAVLTNPDIINTNNLNPQISSFFFCILLFYLFFEVFFSFFRKLYLKKSPLKPDRSHLHMLTYNFLANSLKFKDSNYLNSLLINAIYTSLILPAVFFLDNGLICKYWFFSLLILYIVFYSLLYSFAKKQ